MSTRVRKYLLSSVLSTLVLLTVPAHATWDFVPTALEWEIWPIYCKVQYSWVMVGQNSDKGSAFPDVTKEQWKRTIGDDTFTGLHHYCAGYLYHYRSKFISDPREKRFVLGQALNEVLYTYGRADAYSPIYPAISVTLAQVRIDLGEPQEAISVLERAIEVQPSQIQPYIALAVVHRKDGKLQLAKEVLMRANTASNGESVEVLYNLGLISLDLNEVDAAVEYAKKAYSLGYPLPGLKDRLKKLGRSIDDDT